MTFNAKRLGVELPILDAVIHSNHQQIEAARVKVHEASPRRVGVLGLSFKAGTDDLRESPVIGLIRELWQDGLEVLVHDPDVDPETILGSNLAYLKRQLPQIMQILRTDISEVLDTCDTIIVSKKQPEFTAALQTLGSDTTVIDLVRLNTQPFLPEVAARYQGMSWSSKAVAKVVPLSSNGATKADAAAKALKLISNSTPLAS